MQILYTSVPDTPNVEKPDDTATLENLKQIKESLTQLGIQVQ